MSCTTLKILASELGYASMDQSILWSEFVALCAPESTELLTDQSTRYLPSGLQNLVKRSSVLLYQVTKLQKLDRVRNRKNFILLLEMLFYSLWKKETYHGIHREVFPPFSEWLINNCLSKQHTWNAERMPYLCFVSA